MKRLALLIFGFKTSKRRGRTEKCCILFPRVYLKKIPIAYIFYKILLTKLK